jgi:UDP-GlcNAc:undecaprenyl-phosphate/decaprenyl-phosphate GlcNAc-1-phosphate transferase
LLKLFILSFVVSLGIGYLILKFERLHLRFTSDVAAPGSHKVHTIAVARIGGISIFVGWVVGLLASSYEHLQLVHALVWTGCLLPAFIGGVAEDVTKRIGPAPRLLLSFLSAALAYMLLGAHVGRIDVLGLDPLLSIPAVAFFFTLVAVGGVAHAINIIDGLNGLASAVCMMALLALGYVAFQVGDQEILLLAGLGTAALLGFHIWNYPSGRMFLGDGGAYFLGVYIATTSALLVGRHSAVSPWFGLLLVLYPVWETLFSAYRRRVLQGLPATTADKLHMHNLIHRRVTVQTQSWRTRRNSDASVPMILLAGCNIVPALLWWNDTRVLVACAFGYVVIYTLVYRHLSRVAVNAGKHEHTSEAAVAAAPVAEHAARVVDPANGLAWSEPKPTITEINR